jgi:hypothetical protein
MRNPYNPTPEQIRAWAQTPDATEPIQDWDLLLLHEPHEALYLELAADWGCPARGYFLALLYRLVGDAVRTGFRTRSKAAVLDLLERSRAFRHPTLGQWRQRSRELLGNLDSFDFDAWCGGGLAADAG